MPLNASESTPKSDAISSSERRLARLIDPASLRIVNAVIGVIINDSSSSRGLIQQAPTRQASIFSGSRSAVPANARIAAEISPTSA